MFRVYFLSLAKLRDTAEDLAMWSVKECKLIIQELEDWDPEFNRIPMKKIPKKGGKRPRTAPKILSGGHGLLLVFCTELKYMDVCFVNDC